MKSEKFYECKFILLGVLNKIINRPPAEIKVKQLVSILSLHGHGHKKSFYLENGVEITEYFPKVDGSAYYFLILRKNVSDITEASNVDNLLEQELKLLAYVWLFASGFHLGIEEHENGRKFNSNVERNSADLKLKLLRERGLKEVKVKFTSYIETHAAYPYAPLENAFHLFKKAKDDENLRKVLRYHYEAHLDSTNWYSNLFKIRDVLEEVFGGEKNTKATLGITNNEWSEFGRILNNYDLRHPGNPKNANVALSPQEITTAKLLGRKFIQLYLLHLGLGAYVYQI